MIIKIDKFPHYLEYDSLGIPSIVHPNGDRGVIAIETALMFEILAKLDDINNSIQNLNPL